MLDARLPIDTSFFLHCAITAPPAIHRIYNDVAVPPSAAMASSRFAQVFRHLTLSDRLPIGFSRPQGALEVRKEEK